MTLPAEDSNTTTTPSATQQDAGGNPVPVCPAALIVDGVATPVGPGNPLPVAGQVSIASDGSGTITCGCSAQMLFGGVVPKGGYLVCNNSPHPLYVSDVGAATAGGSAIHIAPHATFVTPSGYGPQQAVSLYGPTTGQSFAARRW
ncbi:MAG TPA: hypothetical protein VHT52_00785 [Stellaceae bacterium]|jgi:hypothetical protein|nr:hypothetical protein [Stellaceae bacterium]